MEVLAKKEAKKAGFMKTWRFAYVRIACNHPLIDFMQWQNILTRHHFSVAFLCRCHGLTFQKRRYIAQSRMIDGMVNFRIGMAYFPFFSAGKTSGKLSISLIVALSWLNVISALHVMETCVKEPM